MVTVLAASPAPAQVYFGELTGGAEVPPNISPGVGMARVTLTGNLMRVEAVFAMLIGTTSAAHIHCCAGPGVNAGVATPLPSFPGFPLGVQDGVYDQVFDLSLASSFSPVFIANQGGLDAARVTFVTSLDQGLTYFNVHTDIFPGGELRGQLIRQTQVVPEPASMALLLTGLAGLGAAHRRRRQKQ